MEYQNNYPVVIVHGLMGWGEQDLVDKTFPHFPSKLSGLAASFRYSLLSISLHSLLL